MKKWLVIIIFIVLVIVLVSWTLIASSYKEIDNYVQNISEKNLITDHSTFYTVDEILNRFLQKFVDANKDEVYDLMSTNYKMNKKKEEFDKAYEDFRSIILYENTSEYEQGQYIGKSEGLLNKLYKVSSNLYVCLLKSEYNENNYYVLLRLNDREKTFQILDFETIK